MGQFWIITRPEERVKTAFTGSLVINKKKKTDKIKIDKLEPSQEKHAKANFNAKNREEPWRTSARFVEPNWPCKEYRDHTDENTRASDQKGKAIL